MNIRQKLWLHAATQKLPPTALTLLWEGICVRLCHRLHAHFELLGWIITDQKLSEDSKNVLSGLRLSACFNLHIPSEALVLPAQAPCPWCRFCAGLPERICHPSAFCFLSRGRGKAYWKPWLSCFLKTQRMHLPPSPVYIKTHRTYDFLTDRITRSVFFFFYLAQAGWTEQKVPFSANHFSCKINSFFVFNVFSLSEQLFFCYSVPLCLLKIVNIVKLIKLKIWLA